MWSAEQLPRQEYTAICPQPMDLRTVREKLERGEYGADGWDALAADVNLVCRNACAYLPATSEVHAAAKRLGTCFAAELKAARGVPDRRRRPVQQLQRQPAAAHGARAIKRELPHGGSSTSLVVRESARKKVKHQRGADNGAATGGPAGSTASKLAAITALAETQLQIIDQLMTQIERSGDAHSPAALVVARTDLPTREMELHEKDALYRNLCKLEPEQLGTACSFARLSEEAGGDAGDYTLDLSKQDNTTLWRLHAYAQRNARSQAQIRAAAKRKLQEQLAEQRRAAAPAAACGSSRSSGSDSSDDEDALSDSDEEEQ
jgi:hypothetical protein